MLPALSSKPKQGVRQVQGLTDDSIDSYSNMTTTAATYADNTTARSGNSTARSTGKKTNAAIDEDGAVLARVVRDRKASGDEELTLRVGDVVKVLSTKRTGYLKCEFNDEVGYVPSSYLEFFEEAVLADPGDGEAGDTARSERRKKKKDRKKKEKEADATSDGDEPAPTARSPRQKAHGEREATHVADEAGGEDSPRKKKKKHRDGGKKSHRKLHEDEDEDAKRADGDESERKPRKHRKKKKRHSDSSASSDSDEGYGSSRHRRHRRHRHRRRHSDSDSYSSTGSSDDSSARRRRRRRHRASSSDEPISDDEKRRSRRRHKHRGSGSDSDNDAGGESSRRKRDEEAKTARDGKLTERSEKATAREESKAAASGTTATTSSTTTTAASKDTKASARGNKDDESRVESSTQNKKNETQSNKGLGKQLGDKMRSLLGGGKKSDHSGKNSSGILNACPNTVQGEEGWYEHGENERYYFILVDGKWSLLYGPMTEEDFEIYCQKVMELNRLVELPATYLHKSGYYLNLDFRVQKGTS